MCVPCMRRGLVWTGRRPARWGLGLLALAAVLAAAPAARAASTHIRDDAKLFSPAIRERAEDEARDLARRYRVNFVIETFANAPWLARLSHNLSDRAARDHYFSDWAERRSKRAGPDGVYALICRQPSPPEVEVKLGRRLAGGKVFLSEQDADGLRNVLLAQLEAGHADQSLLDALRFLRVRLEAVSPATAAGWEPFPWGDMLGIILILVAFWVCVQAIELVSAGPSGPVPPPSAAAESYPASLFAALTTYGLGTLLRAPFWSPATRPVEVITTSEVVPAPPADGAPTIAGGLPADAGSSETATRV